MLRHVLITGARAAAALDLARDFHAAGWKVHLADSRQVRMARWSRLSARHHRYPPPRQQGEAFRTKIMELVKQHDIALVVPTCEEVFHLAEPSLREWLGKRLFTPSLTTLRCLHDKLAFAHACLDWGVPVPESHGVIDADALAHFKPTSREWVFKPCFSRFGVRALVGPSAAELEQIVPSQEQPWLAQRRIMGEEACLHAVAHGGRLVAFASYRSDWRLEGGASYAFEPLPEAQSELLSAMAETLAVSAGIHGQFACDVMFDEAGQPYLIECNPRATSGVHLLVGQGDLARAIGDGTPMTAQAQAATYLAPAMIMFGLPSALRHGRLGQWRSLVARGSDAISRPGDRLPIAGAIADAGAFFLTGLRQRISTNAATTFDIEWNGEEQD